MLSPSYIIVLILLAQVKLMRNNHSCNALRFTRDGTASSVLIVLHISFNNHVCSNITNMIINIFQEILSRSYSFSDKIREKKAFDKGFKGNK